MRNRLTLIVIGGVAGLVVAGGVAYAAAYTVPRIDPQPADRYFACVRASGVVRYGTMKLNVEPSTCPSATDTIRSWNAQGPRGNDGQSGPSSLAALSGSPCRTEIATNGALEVTTDKRTGSVSMKCGGLVSVYVRLINMPSPAPVSLTGVTGPNGIDCRIALNPIPGKLVECGPLLMTPNVDYTFNIANPDGAPLWWGVGSCRGSSAPACTLRAGPGEELRIDVLGEIPSGGW